MKHAQEDLSMPPVKFQVSSSVYSDKQSEYESRPAGAGEAGEEADEAEQILQQDM